MQKTKKILPIAIVFVMAIMALAIVPTVSASVSLNLPLQGRNYTTSIIVNCTADDLTGTVNASVYYNSSGGAATIGTSFLTVIANTSADQEDFYDATVSVAALSDLTTYNFTCIATNRTGSQMISSIGIGGITIDNTDPVNTMTSDYSSVNLGRYFKYTITIADATSGLDGTEYCNVTDAEGDVDKDGSISTSASAIEFTNTHEAGNYVISCTSTDYAGNTATDTLTVTAKTGGSPIPFGEGVAGASFPEGLDSTKVIIAIVVILLIAMAERNKK